MLSTSKISSILEANPIYGYLGMVVAVLCIIFEFSLPHQYSNNLTNMLIFTPAVIFPFILKSRSGYYILISIAIAHLFARYFTGQAIETILFNLLPFWILAVLFYILLCKQLKYREDIEKELSLRKELEKEAVMESVILQEKNSLLEQEILERRKIQKELRTANTYYANLIDNAGIAMGIADLQGNISYVNEIFASIYKLSKEEIIGQPFVNMLPDYEQAKLYRLFSDKISGEQTPGNLITHILDSEGNLIHVQLISDLVFENDEIAGVRAYIWDITEQVLTENAIRESEEKFRSIFEFSPMGIYRSSVEGRIILANPALLKMLRYPDLETLKGIDLNQKHPALYDRGELIAELEENGKVIGKVAEWERYDGAILYIKETSWVIHDEEGNIKYFDGIIDDVTEQVQAEQEKERLIEQLMSAKSEIHRLSGMLPICSNCKKIRDDTGYWHQLEVYIDDHSDAQFSHGICPDCAQSLYPDYADDED